MKERPILFSAPMVRAILADAKTQTRRVVKWKLREAGLNLAFSGLETGAYACDDYSTGWVLRSRGANSCWNDRTFPMHCPYGAAGDRLWVREAFTQITGNEIRTHYRADGEPLDSDGNPLPTRPGTRRWWPSIHMSRNQSRITLEVTGVRVERLHAITEEDAKAEGVPPTIFTRKVYPSKHAAEVEAENYRDSFQHLWNKINGAESWISNPFVWVVTFKRVEAQARAA